MVTLRTIAIAINARDSLVEIVVGELIREG